MTLDEWHEAHEALITEPAVIEALAKRGITDLDLVLIDTWAYGHSLIPEDFAGPAGRLDRRLAALGAARQPLRQPGQRPALHRRHEHDGAAAGRGHPAAGRAPPSWASTCPALVPGLQQRTDIKPLEITQPEGVSFSLDGNELRWQNWTMRLGFNHREGLVIHRVAYQDGDELRPIAHRLSFAEMVVPYRDPSPDHHRRTAFDIGEWGLGFMTTSLELGCDCLGEITYVDAVLHDSKGEPYHDHERHLPARGGRRRAVEARRREGRGGGPPVAADGGLVPRDRGQLRVPHLLALLPGRHDRVRGPRHRDHGDQRVRRRSAAVRHGRRRAHLRAVPPALHRRPPGHGGRRAGEHGRRLRERGAAGVRGQPATAWRWCSAAGRC